MTPVEENAAGRLGLLLKRYGWMVVLSTIAIGALGVTVGPRAPGGDQRYETSAVIVAQQLQIRPEGFPRLAEAIFETGSVRERAVLLADLPYDPTDLIPERAELRPFENTVVLEVIGRDEDPQLAADIANGVATAFTDELNRAGPGVGVFAVQDTARVPTVTLRQSQVPVTLFLALSVGFLLGLGLVSLYSLIRRPVLTPGEAATAAGAPLVASLRLPRNGIGKATIDDPPVGVAAVARGLFPKHTGMGALVPVRRAERATSELAILTSSVLGSRGAVYLVASGGLPPELEERAVALAPAIPGDVAHQSPVIVDHPSEFDLLTLGPAGAQLFLVVTTGTPRPVVDEATQQFLAGEITGTVFVSRPRFSLRQNRRIRTAVTGTEDSGVLHRRRAELQEELRTLQGEIERAGTTLRSLVREAQDLRNRADQELEAELERRRSELVNKARETVWQPRGPRPPRPQDPSTSGR